MNNGQDKKVWIAYVLVAFLWGSTYLAIRLGVTNFPPLIFSSTRLVTAGTLLLLFCRWKKKEIPKNKKEILKIALAGFIMLTLSNGSVVIAEQWVESGFISLLVASSPIFVLLGEAFLLKRIKTNWMQMGSVLIGFWGVFLLASNTDLSHIPLNGLILSLLAPIFWATGSLYASSFQAKGNLLAISGIQMISGGLGQGILSLFLKEYERVAPVTGTVLLSWLYLIIFGSIIGYTCYQYTLQHMPASVAVTATYINPVVAVFLGALLLQEQVTLLIMISSVLIITSVVLLNRLSKKREKTKKVFE